MAREHGKDLSPDRLLTAVEVGEALQVSRSTVYELLLSGQLGSIHIGRLRRIRANELASFIARLEGGEQND